MGCIWTGYSYFDITGVVCGIPAKKGSVQSLLHNTRNASFNSLFLQELPEKLLCLSVKFFTNISGNHYHFKTAESADSELADSSNQFYRIGRNSTLQIELASGFQNGQIYIIKRKDIRK